jgi:hypothetical protein
MAKNYKRHAQGQRFKRPDFGDMGLRAYQQQQRNIIDGMKLQAAQSEKIHNEYLSSDIDKARKEKEHREKLKVLEDNVHNNKEKWTEIAADREIDALKEKAKDYGKSADFWKNFSTTHSKQYGEAVGNILDIIDFKSAQKIVNQQRGSGGIYEQAITNSKVLNNISSSGIINEVDKIYTDPNNSGHFKRTEHAHSLDIEKRRSHNLNNILSSQLIEDSDKIITHLKDTLERFDPKNPDKKRVKITKDNIEDLIQQRALEIMGNLGMDPNSEGGKKFLDHMWEVAGDEAFKRHKLEWAEEDEDNLYNIKDGLLAGLKANINKDVEWEAKFNHTIKLFQYRYVVGEDGDASLQQMNVKQAYSAVQDLLINEGIITRENFDKLNIAFPGQAIPAKVVVDPTLDTRTLMWERHSDLIREAEVTLLKKEKFDNQQKNSIEEADDDVSLTKILAGIESGDIDPNNSDQIGALINGHPGRKNTLDYLHKIKVFNPKQNDSLGYLVNEKINSAYNNNDYIAYREAMQFLGKEDRQQFNEFTRQLDELNSSGATNKQVRDYIEEFIKGELGITDLNTRTNATAGPMADAMVQDFYFQYREIANDPKYTSGRARVSAAFAKVIERYESEKGIYRQKPDTTGANTVFPAMLGIVDETKGLDSEALQEKVAEGWDALFDEIEAAEGDAGVANIHLVDQDYLDLSLNQIINGENVGSNAAIDYLYHTQPVRDKMFSKTEILNKYLAAKGIKTQVPLGALDHITKAAENSIININNFHRMNDENKMRMAVLLEFLNNTPDGKMPYKPNTYTIETDKIRMKYMNRYIYKRSYE